MIYSGSRQDDWETPKELYNKLNSIFNFSCDLAASEKNKKTDFFFSEKNNSLTKNWDEINGVSWLNPPFSKSLQFFKKASASKNKVVAIYKSANVEARVWQDFIFPNAEVFFLRGRVNYEGKKTKSGVTFGSAIIFFRIDDRQIKKVTKLINGTAVKKS